MFLHIKRQPAYNIQSLLKARNNYYGDIRGWYSFKPPEYDELKEFVVARDYSFEIECYPGYSPNLDTFLIHKTRVTRLNHTCFSIFYQVLINYVELQKQGVKELTVCASEVNGCFLTLKNASDPYQFHQAYEFTVIHQDVFSCTVKANFTSLSNLTYLYLGEVYDGGS